MGGDVICSCRDLTHVGVAAGSRWRADAQKNDLRVRGHGLVGGKRKASVAERLCEEMLQARLKKRDPARREFSDPGLLDIQTDHFVTQPRETDSSNGADVPCPHDYDTSHLGPPNGAH